MRRTRLREEIDRLRALLDEQRGSGPPCKNDQVEVVEKAYALLMATEWRAKLYERLFYGVSSESNNRMLRGSLGQPTGEDEGA